MQMKLLIFQLINMYNLKTLKIILSFLFSFTKLHREVEDNGQFFIQETISNSDVKYKYFGWKFLQSFNGVLCSVPSLMMIKS